MALFAALAWTPFLLPKEDLRVIHDVQWGAYSVENNRVVLRVYGDFRDLVAAYGQTHRVMALAAHFFGNVDPRDSEELQKSPLHYIATGQTIFVIPTDDKFTKEVQNGPPGISYLYLMVPKEVEANQFKTIRQAERLGAKVLVSGSGPP